MTCKTVIWIYSVDCITFEYCGNPARKEWFYEKGHVIRRALCEKHIETPRRSYWITRWTSFSLWKAAQ